MAVASFPEVHITGPVHHYIQAIGGQIYYLGTAEVTPQIQVRRYRSNTMNDVAGKTLPLQKTWDGEAAVVSVLLTNFSKFAEQELQTSGRTNGVQLTERAGIETRWARGSAVYGKSTFKLWQVYDNFFNPFGTSTGLEIGWYWPQVELLQRGHGQGRLAGGGPSVRVRLHAVPHPPGQPDRRERHAERARLVPLQPGRQHHRLPGVGPSASVRHDPGLLEDPEGPAQVTAQVSGDHGITALVRVLLQPVGQDGSGGVVEMLPVGTALGPLTPQERRLAVEGEGHVA
jgi:hypothetical protein